MAIRTRTTDGYQQVELTSELLHGPSGATQQVISTVPCSKHLPFFISILLADIFLFGSVLLFAIYAAKYGDGFSLDQQPDFPYRQFNLHALIMITAFVYLNGQAITVYKSNYLVKHKSINMLYHFVLHLLTIGGILGGLYMAYNAQEAIQRPAKASHFYSMHSWTGLTTIGLFSLQVSVCQFNNLQYSFTTLIAIINSLILNTFTLQLPVDATKPPTHAHAQFLFGFFSFFVTLCCRKVSARMRAKALPVHRTFAMIVLCSSVATVISGLTQMARFQLTGVGGKPDYRDVGSLSTLLINLTGVSVLAATVLIFFITFIFKRRQAHDLPILFKIILLIAQFVEIVLILVVAEFIFQVVTPHVNKVINGELLNNTTLTHIFNNATQSINSLIVSATQHISNLANLDSGQNSTEPSTTTTGSSIILGSTNLTAGST